MMTLESSRESMDKMIDSHTDQANVAHALLQSNAPDEQAISTAIQGNLELEK